MSSSVEGIKLGVRVKVDELDLAPEEAEAYDWFKDRLVRDVRVPAAMAPVPRAEEGLEEWYQHHPAKASLDRLLDYVLALINASPIIIPLRSLDRRELLASIAHESRGLFPSLTAQVWYFFEQREHNPILHAFQVHRREKTLALKRKQDEIFVAEQQEAVRRFKRQRVLTLSLDNLPLDMVKVIADYLPARDVLSLLRETSKQYDLGERVIDDLIARDFPDRSPWPLIPVGMDARKVRFLEWLYASTIAKDTANLAVASAYHRHLPRLQAKFVKYVARVSQWPGSVLQLFYKTVAFTMANPFMTLAGVYATAPIHVEILGASGLHIRASKSGSNPFHWKLVSFSLGTDGVPHASPSTDREVALLLRLRELQDAPSRDFMKLCLFLLTSVDPTATIWYPYKHCVTVADADLVHLKTRARLNYGSAFETTVAANAMAAGLQWGARYHYEYSPVFPPINTERSPTVTLDPERDNATLSAMLNVDMRLNLKSFLFSA